MSDQAEDQWPSGTTHFGVNCWVRYVFCANNHPLTIISGTSRNLMLQLTIFGEFELLAGFHIHDPAFEESLCDEK